jgi:hypothetical protein
VPVGSNWLGDDHQYIATLRDEGLTAGHKQPTAEEAAIRGWFYRPNGDSTQPLEPDTRRCSCHGEIVFAPLTLTTAEKAIRHPLSPNRLRGENP